MWPSYVAFYLSSRRGLTSHSYAFWLRLWIWCFPLFDLGWAIMVRLGLCFGLLASLQASLIAAQAANSTAIKQACDDIDAQFSDASDVLTFRGIRFYQAIDHWMESSDQTPRCVVQPASVQDLSTAVGFRVPCWASQPLMLTDEDHW